MRTKHWLFQLRGELKPRQELLLSAVGIAVFLLGWILLTFGETPVLKPATLPSPARVLSSYSDLLRDNDLIVNTCKSIGLNLSGYVLALLISIPLGFLIGLLPIFRGLFQRFLDAIRFVPLIATIGLFIVWFGIGIYMKSSFLAFGIIIFFLPVVVQRIDEVKDVYLKTVYTLGATDWQTVKTVYFPSVMSRLWNDLRIMTAISWTYITFVETINSQGGLGDILIYGARRQGRIDKMFALLILIIAIGIFQDKIFVYMDKKLFPHKYQNKGKYDHLSSDDEDSVFDIITDYAWQVLIWLTLAAYLAFTVDQLTGVLGNINLIDHLFGGTSWVIHFIFISTIVYKVVDLITKSKTTV